MTSPAEIKTEDHPALELTPMEKRRFGLWLLAVVGLWAVLLAVGLSGDSVSALFAGLAFAGLLYALGQQNAQLVHQRKQLELQTQELVLQRRELELQREELRETRGEIQRQADALEQQSATLRRQGFEGSFYQLLRFWRDTAERVQVGEGGAVDRGPAAFARLENQLVNQMPAALRHKGTADVFPKVMHTTITRAALGPTGDVRSYLGTLEQLLKLVDREQEDRAFFIDIIRAQMSNDEATVVAFGILALRLERAPTLRDAVVRNDLLRDLRLDPNLEPLRKQVLSAEPFEP
jgi:hypothetical protein